jgi:hypothetical protein
MHSKGFICIITKKTEYLLIDYCTVLFSVVPCCKIDGLDFECVKFSAKKNMITNILSENIVLLADKITLRYVCLLANNFIN